MYRGVDDGEKDNRITEILIYVEPELVTMWEYKETMYWMLQGDSEAVSEDIHKFVQKFASFNKPGIDVLDTLNDVAENNELLKLGGPVGSLIAAGLDIVFDPTSDEQKAIRELHYEMNRQFDGRNGKVGCFALGLSPRHRSGFTQRFIQRQIQFSMHIPDQQTDSHFEQILTWITMLMDNRGEMIISKLENIRATRREDIVKAFHGKEIEDLFHGPIRRSCILEVVNNAHGYVRVNFSAIVQELTIDLIKTQLMTVACANITTGGDERAIQYIVEEATKKVEGIGKHVVSWVRKVQSLSWPEISIEAAKRALGFNPISVASFNESARKVREEFEKYGSESDSYQVLITDTKEMDTYWSVKTERPGIYANFTNFNGIDCHIFRYDKDASDRADNAIKWFEEKHNALLTALKYGMQWRYTSYVLMYLYRAIGPLVQSQMYRSVILLRNKAFWANNAQINIGLVSWKCLDMNATSNVDFFENHFYAYAVKLYFFL
ncbi:hypothetical protein FO519_005866 [Halicephalobus sp. NKZ332]|nr:hypothetical protein FO519_005866 [Halicephalobus sp. NKZ332]